MMTIGQLLVVSGQSPRDTLSTNALLAKLSVRRLSLKSVIAAYERQRIVVFVSLVSPKVFRSHNVRLSWPSCWKHLKVSRESWTSLKYWRSPGRNYGNKVSR